MNRWCTLPLPTTTVFSTDGKLSPSLSRLRSTLRTRGRCCSVKGWATSNRADVFDIGWPLKNIRLNCAFLAWQQYRIRARCVGLVLGEGKGCMIRGVLSGWANYLLTTIVLSLCHVFACYLRASAFLTTEYVSFSFLLGVPVWDSWCAFLWFACRWSCGWSRCAERCERIPVDD